MGKKRKKKNKENEVTEKSDMLLAHVVLVKNMQIILQIFKLKYNNKAKMQGASKGLKRTFIFISIRYTLEM